MPSCRYKTVGLGLLLSGGLVSFNLAACNVPVFRYALERWTPDPYVAVIFRDEELPPSTKATVEELQNMARTTGANLLVRQSDTSGILTAGFRELWKAQTNPALPWMVLRYPAQTGIGPSVWAGPAAEGMRTNLLNSPARERISRALSAGDSAVWLLLEGADKQNADRIETLLNSESKKLTQTLELPILGPDDPEISSDLPLRVAFSTVRVRRDDPAEKMLVLQLLSWQPVLSGERGPILFPVFGRGRVLPPAVGKSITSETIWMMARLITGPCSCQIKEMNAGFDLLMAVDWAVALRGGGEAPRQGPPLVGITQWAQSGSKIDDQHTTSSAPPGSLQPAGNNLARNFGVVTVVALLFVAVTTFLLRAKPERAAPD